MFLIPPIPPSSWECECALFCCFYCIAPLWFSTVLFFYYSYFFSAIRRWSFFHGGALPRVFTFFYSAEIEANSILILIDLRSRGGGNHISPHPHPYIHSREILTIMIKLGKTLGCCHYSCTGAIPRNLTSRRATLTKAGFTELLVMEEVVVVNWQGCQSQEGHSLN